MRKTHRFKMNKLVRDNLSKIMEDSNIKLFDRVMGKDEYLKKLKEKLLEEFKEISIAKDKVEIEDSLVDIIEVIRALSNVYEIDLEEIYKQSEIKRSEKGGFDNRIYAAQIELGSDHPKIGYYKSRPEEYSEVK